MYLLLFAVNTNKKKNDSNSFQKFRAGLQKLIAYIHRDSQFNNLTWLNFMWVEFKFTLEKIEEIN